MEPVVIRNTQSPGDIIVLTAALRDISKTYPGRFRFGIDCGKDVSSRSMFLNNPHIDMALQAGRQLVAKYPLVHQSNQQKVHFLWGFLEYLNEQLKTSAKLLEFKPALYLSKDEMASPPAGVTKPYWVFASGGKKDFTAKWWDYGEWAKVVGVMSRWTTMVQVGGGSHVHPPIPNTVNLIGKTSLRELMRLVYHSEGVMCVVTCLMHMAAAFNKPCVVVAGGREPYYWEAYTHENRVFNMRRGHSMWTAPDDGFIPHRFIHTLGNAPGNVGTLPCCQNSGCWSGRVGIKPAGDKHRYCRDYVNRSGQNLPHCLSMITFEHVLKEVEWYYTSNILNKTHPSTMIQMLVDPESAKPPEPRLEHVVKSPEPVLSLPVYEAAAKSVQTGVAINSAGITTADIEHYGRIDACLMELKPRLKALRMFAGQSKTASWLAWLEEPVRPRGAGWYTRLLAKLDRDPAAAWGVVCWKPFPDHVLSLRMKLPAVVKDLPPHPLDPKRTILYYLRRGWMLLPKSVVDDLPWDIFSEEEFELELGMHLHQRGIKLRDAGELVEG
jgi:ADP-heptose:LPS heptosyltransferase